MKKILFFVLVVFPILAFGQKETPFRIVEQKINESSEKEKFSIEATYPKIETADGKALEAVNSAIFMHVDKAIYTFKEAVKENLEARENQPADMTYEIVIGYEVKQFDENILSLLIGNYEFTGGAHPASWSDSYTFDLKNDARIYFDALFQNEGYLNVLSTESARLLKEKIGKNAEGYWIEDGTAPEPQNFQVWNITPEGFLITFNDYQVAPYVAGSFEVTIPYEKFATSMRGPKFWLAEQAGYIDGSPANYCRNGRWASQDGQYGMAKISVPAKTRAYFYDDDNDCPNGKNCRRKAYLVQGDEVLVQREYGDFSCVWYQPAKGSETVGWIKTNELTAIAPNLIKSPDWTGVWSDGTSTVTISRSKTGEYRVVGESFWQGVGDNIHTGELDFAGKPEGNTLKVGEFGEEYGCVARFIKLGRYLLASDNLMCGGANVSFNGVYTKRK
ncbi:MAG: DUF3298 and DUF4163 domain-containing protein [Pyrinomonadaceae bacterium]